MILPDTRRKAASALPPPATGLEAVLRSRDGVAALAAVLQLECLAASRQPTERAYLRAMVPSARSVYACARDGPLPDIVFHTLMRSVSTVPESIYRPYKPL